jgi:hypothetical protein
MGRRGVRFLLRHVPLVKIFRFEKADWCYWILPVLKGEDRAVGGLSVLLFPSCFSDKTPTIFIPET